MVYMDTQCRRPAGGPWCVCTFVHSCLQSNTQYCYRFCQRPRRGVDTVVSRLPRCGCRNGCKRHKQCEKQRQRRHVDAGRRCGYIVGKMQGLHCHAVAFTGTAVVGCGHGQRQLAGTRTPFYRHSRCAQQHQRQDDRRCQYENCIFHFALLTAFSAQYCVLPEKKHR